MEKIREAALAAKPVPVPVIDAHTHLLPYRLKGWYQAYDKTEDVIHQMDRLGIDCIVTAPHPLINGTMEVANAAAAEAAELFPGRVKGYICIQPYQGVDEVKAQISKYSQNPNFLGLKFLIKYHGNLPQAEYEYALDFADEMACPVLIHNYGDWEGLQNIRRALEKRSKIRIIVAHQGGGYAPFSRELAKIMRDHDNCFMELCGSLENRYSVEDLIGLVGEDRLIYGSDLINLDPAYDFGKVAFSPIDDEIKRKVFALNYLSTMKDSQMGKLTLVDPSKKGNGVFA